MDEPRVAVTTEEFQRAMTIWLRLAPKSIERRWTKWLQLREAKRDLPEHRVDLAAEFAAVAAKKLAEAGWEVTRIQKEGPLFGFRPPA